MSFPWSHSVQNLTRNQLWAIAISQGLSLKWISDRYAILPQSPFYFKDACATPWLGVWVGMANENENEDDDENEHKRMNESEER